MDWEEEVANHPDDPNDLELHGNKALASLVPVGGDEEANSERCVICLMALRDRTIVGVCGHEFCVSAPK